MHQHEECRTVWGNEDHLEVKMEEADMQLNRICLFFES